MSLLFLLPFPLKSPHCSPSDLFKTHILLLCLIFNIVTLGKNKSTFSSWSLLPLNTHLLREEQTSAFVQQTKSRLLSKAAWASDGPIPAELLTNVILARLCCSHTGRFSVSQKHSLLSLKLSLLCFHFPSTRSHLFKCGSLSGFRCYHHLCFTDEKTETKGIK